MHKFIVYGKPDCPYCRDVTEYLKAEDKAFSYVDIQETGLMQVAFKAAYKTVPQVFLETEHDVVHIGDSQDFLQYITDNS